VLSELRDRVRAAELERVAERGRTGGRVLGRRAVLAQSWSDRPASYEPRRNLRPRVAARSKWARIEALLRNRAFAVEYASARERWRNGIPAVFPLGTYWLQRFASVPVRPRAQGKPFPRTNVVRVFPRAGGRVILAAWVVGSWRIALKPVGTGVSRVGIRGPLGDSVSVRSTFAQVTLGNRPLQQPDL
jgi:hypothetical protein